MMCLMVQGCSWSRDNFQIYKADKVQGNVLKQADVNQLKPGMSKEQVRFILGSPILIDPFNTDRWDYVYRFDQAEGDTIKKRLTLFFSNNRLVNLTGTIIPNDA